jgi:hypothetical protein
MEKAIPDQPAAKKHNVSASLALRDSQKLAAFGSAKMDRAQASDFFNELPFPDHGHHGSPNKVALARSPLCLLVAGGAMGANKTGPRHSVRVACIIYFNYFLPLLFIDLNL